MYRIWILVGQIQFFGIVFPGIVIFLPPSPPPKEEILADEIWGIKTKKVCGKKILAVSCRRARRKV